MSKKDIKKKIEEELEELAKKYNITISWGCGCCGGGITFNDDKSGNEWIPGDIG